MIPAVALVAWPVVCLVLFKTLEYRQAIIWSILGGFLFLPVKFEFDAPGLPPIDKVLLPSVITFAICYFFIKKKEIRLPDTLPILLLFSIPGIAAVISAYNNPEPLIYYDPIRDVRTVVRGLSLYDGFALAFRVVGTTLTFLIARAYLSRDEDLLLLIKTLVIGALIYTLPILLEVRLSPQLHIWIYGYFPHSFAQTARGDGFRPVVFLGHGLLVASYISMCVGCAFILWRTKVAKVLNLPMIAVCLGLFVILILCKSFASIAYALVIIALLFTPKKVQLYAALTCTLIFASYPLLRGNDYIPTKWLVESAEKVSAERAHSLNYRFENEDILMERAWIKPFFGWAGNGRNFVRKEEGWGIGMVISIIDGWWAIIFGAFGWVGYIARSILLVWPVLLIYRLEKKKDIPDFKPHVISFAMVYSILLCDQLINNSVSPLLWLIAGALWGCAERHKKKMLGTEEETTPPTPDLDKPIERDWGIKRY